MPRKKKELSLETLKKKVVPMIDTRATDDNGILVQRDRKITMVDIFGDEQKAAVAYFTSELLAKGFNSQQIIETVENKYGLKWTMRQVNIVKELLKRVWRAEIAYTMNEQIAKELSSIDVQIKELWEAWEFSKKGIKHSKNRREKSSSDAPEMSYDVTEVITEEDTTAGDPRYMSQIASLGVERRKLLGLYAPEKKEQNGPKTAVQLNFVGESTGEGGLNVLSQILSMGVPQQQQQQVVEAAAEVVDSAPVPKPANNEVDIDKLMEEFLD